MFFNADVVAVAKKNLTAGEMLDGEGGFASRGRLVSSNSSAENNFLPLGLTDGAKTKRAIKKDEFIKNDDVEVDCNKVVLEARRYQMKNLN